MHKQKTSKCYNSGFTIVELLVIIVIIGILALLAINMFASAQDKARRAAVEHALASLVKTGHAARVNKDMLLKDISGSAYTPWRCADAGVPLYTLPPSHGCWTDTNALLDTLSEVVGTNLDQFKAGDPWGSPYLIDENEGEFPNICDWDQIFSAGKDGLMWTGDDISDFIVPHCA